MTTKLEMKIAYDKVEWKFFHKSFTDLGFWWTN